MGPAPKPITPKPAPASSTNATPHSALPHPYVPSYSAPPSSGNLATAPEFKPEAPPSIGLSPAGSDTSLFGRFVVPATPPPPPKPPETRTKPPSEPMRVSEGVQMAKLIRKVTPVYPPLAKTTRVSGMVHLVGIIAKDGTIRDLRLISGHPWLARAAMETVQQWIYKPTLLNGEPVEVIAPIDVSFTLSQ